MIAYGLSAIEPALNPTPNQTSAGPGHQKNYESKKVSHLATIHRWWWWSRTLCRAPSSALLDQGRRCQLGPPGISQCPKILLLFLLLHYFSVVNLFGTSTSLRCVSIVKDCLKGSFLADFFVRRDRAPVGQAGVAHLVGGCHLEMSVSNILFKRSQPTKGFPNYGISINSSSC